MFLKELKNFLLLRFVADGKLGDLLAFELGKFRAEWLRAFMRVEMQGPVFLRLEVLDLDFAFSDEPERRALHAAGGQPAADFLPQHWRKVETDQIIQRPAGLLGVDQRHGNVARIVHRVLDRRLGDFIEHHALQTLVL